MENLEQIKQQIKDGVTTSSKSFADTDEIIDLYREYLALKSVEGKAQGEYYEHLNSVFNEKLDKLAHRLNIPFINEHYTNKIMDILKFDETLSEKLSDVEFTVYKNRIKGKHPYEEIRTSLEGNGYNVYDTFAKLNGFDNIMDYQEAERKKQEQFELQTQKERERKERIDEMKQAYKEALKEHQQNI